VHGVAPEDLLRMPHPEFFRRRGMPAFRMVGHDGQPFDDVNAYLKHLYRQLPESYQAGRDFKEYVDALRQVERGELTREAAASRMPALRRVGGACPCSNSVRWVVDEPATAVVTPGAGGTVGTVGAAAAHPSTPSAPPAA